jgi:hypothetical protein
MLLDEFCKLAWIKVILFASGKDLLQKSSGNAVA